MATMSPKNASATMLLDGGLSSDGKAITLRCSMGTLKTTATADQISAVMQAAAPCLERDVTSAEFKTTSIVTNDTP